jgi:hypothetical protein
MGLDGHVFLPCSPDLGFSIAASMAAAIAIDRLRKRTEI